MQRSEAASGGASSATPTWVAASVAGLVFFLAVGGLGLYRYLGNFWVYRGFAPTHDPAYVVSPGIETSFDIASPALGGRRQQVVVYLPPGYDAQPARRYPVLYLLHGSPGTPHAFMHELRMGVLDDVYTTLRRAQPLILVMPFGSTGQFTDKEWANGYRPHQAWETFLARDVVRAVDQRYRTIANGSGRALAGLSEGGYGALNIGLHHPGEFRVLESWSGYERADDLGSVFGHRPDLLARNSPLLTLDGVGSALRRAHTFVWKTIGFAVRGCASAALPTSRAPVTRAPSAALHGLFA